MQPIHNIVLFLSITTVLSCGSKTTFNQPLKNSASDSVKSAFTIKSYMETDRVYQGEPAPFHVEIKNESLDTFVVIQAPRLTFLPSPGWNKTDELLPFRYSGPAWVNLYPGEIMDCGRSDIAGFKEIPLGYSTLRFTLELCFNNKKDTVILMDSLLVNAFPPRTSR
jgi:hypothetical protein